MEIILRNRKFPLSILFYLKYNLVKFSCNKFIILKNIYSLQRKSAEKLQKIIFFAKHLLFKLLIFVVKFQ